MSCFVMFEGYSHQIQKAYQEDKGISLEGCLNDKPAQSQMTTMFSGTDVL